jgi:hypothetical protein
MMFKGVPSTLVVEELLHNELRRADAAGELSSSVVRPVAMLAACRNRVSTCYQHNNAGKTDQRAFPLLAAAELRCNELGKGLTLLGSSPATSYALWKLLNSRELIPVLFNRFWCFAQHRCSSAELHQVCTKHRIST